MKNRLTLIEFAFIGFLLFVATFVVVYWIIPKTDSQPSQAQTEIIHPQIEFGGPPLQEKE